MDRQWHQRWRRCCLCRSEYEGKEYTFSTSVDMDAGTYDLRVRAMDARGQTSDWKVVLGSDALTVTNALPTIWAEPVPTVMCDEPTKISMEGHITDKKRLFRNERLLLLRPSWVGIPPPRKSGPLRL